LNPATRISVKLSEKAAGSVRRWNRNSFSNNELRFCQWWGVVAVRQRAAELTLAKAPRAAPLAVPGPSREAQVYGNGAARRERQRRVEQ
jgi:hypothetical protein